MARIKHGPAMHVGVSGSAFPWDPVGGDPTGAILQSPVTYLSGNDFTSQIQLLPLYLGLSDGGVGFVELNNNAIRLYSTIGVVVPTDFTDDSLLTGEDGAIRYSLDTNKFRGYENGAWVDMIGGGSGHTHVYSEVPSGTVNGSNDTFTLAGTPASGTLRLYKNGLRQKAGAGNDYTLATATITFLAGNIPQTGDTLLADYE